MEKNGKLQLTKEEFDLYLSGNLAPSLTSKGVVSYPQLSEIINSGEYELV